MPHLDSCGHGDPGSLGGAGTGLVGLHRVAQWTGPFQGFGFYVRVACGSSVKFTDDWAVKWAHECFDDSDENIRYVVEVRGLFPTSGEGRPRLLVSPADTRPVGCT